MSSPEPSMEEEPKEEKTSLTFLTLGSSTVGKSSFITRYTKNIFRENTYSTVGLDFQTKTITMFDKTITVKLYDTAGQERFRGLSRAYYKNADGIILIFNIANRTSFNDVEVWRNEIKENGNSRTSIILIGNKKDLEDNRETSKEEAQALAKKYEMDYFEASAKTGDNINQAVEHLVEICLKKKELITSMMIRKKEEKAIRLEQINKAQNIDRMKCC